MTAQSPELSDSELLRQMERGDVDSFETLFYRHYDRVYGLLFRLVGDRAEAEDLLQEVFLKLYNQAWRPRFGREHNVSAWLYRVATNTGYNAIRGRTRRQTHDIVLVPSLMDREADPAVTAERNEEIARVRAALTSLKPQQAQLLLLRQMGLSYNELAEACQINPKSVGKLLSRARDALQLAYHSTGGEK